MKRNVLRSVLLLGLLTSLLIRHSSIGERSQLLDNYNTEEVICELLRENRLTVLHNPVLPPKTLSRMVYFQRPGCDKKSIVMPFSPNNDAMRIFRRLNKPDYNLHFHYFDRSWSRQHRATLFALWIRHTFLSVINASSFVPVKEAILVADPPGFTDEDPVPWHMVWDRATFLERTERKSEERSL